MNDDTQVNVRVNSHIKRLFQKRCIDLGVHMTTLLAIFMAEVASGRLTYVPDREPPIFEPERKTNDQRTNA